MRAAVVLIALVLAGCATTKERIVYRDVVKPVPVPCISKPLPDPEPKETDSLDLSTASLQEMVRAILIDREKSKVADANLRSLIKACGG